MANEPVILNVYDMVRLFYRFPFSFQLCFLFLLLLMALIKWHVIKSNAEIMQYENNGCVIIAV